VERKWFPLSFSISSEGGSERGGPRRGSFANGAGEFDVDRLEVRGTGLGTDGGGSLSHSTGDKSRDDSSGGSAVKVTTSSVEEGRTAALVRASGGGLASSDDVDDVGEGIFATSGMDFLGGTGIESGVAFLETFFLVGFFVLCVAEARETRDAAGFVSPLSSFGKRVFFLDWVLFFNDVLVVGSSLLLCVTFCFCFDVVVRDLNTGLKDSSSEDPSPSLTSGASFRRVFADLFRNSIAQYPKTQKRP
jgi:hypothetical protein